MPPWWLTCVAATAYLQVYRRVRACRLRSMETCSHILRQVLLQLAAVQGQLSQRLVIHQLRNKELDIVHVFLGVLAWEASNLY